MRCLRDAVSSSVLPFCVSYFSRSVKFSVAAAFFRRIFMPFLLMVSHVVFCLEPDEHEDKDDRLQVPLWNQAVAAGDMETAVRLSKSFIPSIRAVPDPWDHARRLLFSHSEISPSFLDASFNEYDFALWRRKLFFFMLSHQFVPETASDDEAVKILFDAVRSRLAKGDLKQRDQGVNLWPEIIWQERAGYCDRQAWCLSELLLQQGFHVVLIMLFDEDGVSPHTFLEAEKDSKFFLLDPFYDKMISGKSFRDMETDETLPQNFWPGRRNLQQASVSQSTSFPRLLRSTRKATFCYSKHCGAMGERKQNIYIWTIPLLHWAHTSGNIGLSPNDAHFGPIRFLCWQMISGIRNHPAYFFRSHRK